MAGKRRGTTLGSATLSALRLESPWSYRREAREPGEYSSASASRTRLGTSKPSDSGEVWDRVGCGVDVVLRVAMVVGASTASDRMAWSWRGRSVV